MRLDFKIKDKKFSSRILLPLLLLAIVIFPCNSHDSNFLINLKEEKNGGNPDFSSESMDVMKMSGQLNTEEKISLLFMPVIENPESPVFDSEKRSSVFPGGFMLSDELFKNPEQVYKKISVLKNKFAFFANASDSEIPPFVSCFAKTTVLEKMGTVLPDPHLVGASGSKYIASLYASLIEKKYSALGINLLLPDTQEKSFCDDQNLNLSLQRTFSEKLCHDENPFSFHALTLSNDENLVSDFADGLKKGADFFLVADFFCDESGEDNFSSAIKKLSDYAKADKELLSLIDSAVKKNLSLKKNDSENSSWKTDKKSDVKILGEICTSGLTLVKNKRGFFPLGLASRKKVLIVYPPEEKKSVDETVRKIKKIRGTKLSFRLADFNSASKIRGHFDYLICVNKSAPGAFLRNLFLSCDTSVTVQCGVSISSELYELSDSVLLCYGTGSSLENNIAISPALKIIFGCNPYAFSPEGFLPVEINLGRLSSGDSVCLEKNHGIMNWTDILSKKTMRGIWFSYFDWAALPKNQEDFTAEVSLMMEKISSLGLNTLILHAHSHSDSYYKKSALFPVSKFLLGDDGAEPDFDPYEIMIDAAHKKNISVHAWFNPYRVTGAGVGRDFFKEGSIICGWLNSGDDSRKILLHKGQYYLNPSIPEVREKITDCVRDFVKNYDVDGIQFDDYFYPMLDDYDEDLSFDKAEYDASGSEIGIIEWRRKNVSDLISSVYKAVHEEKAEVVFGVSPAGNLSNLRSGWQYFADVDKWMSEPGYVDFILPQLYWGFELRTGNGNLSPYAFESVLESWTSLPRIDSVDLNVGLALYRAGTDVADNNETSEWLSHDDIILRQIQVLGENEDVSGFALFDYRDLFRSEARDEVLNFASNLTDGIFDPEDF